MSSRSAPGAPSPTPRRRRVVAAVGAVSALGLAVAVPLVLDGRRAGAADALRADLQHVATAQAAWHDAHGSYSTSLRDLRVPAARTDVAIVSAGADGFCAGAWDDGTRTALFYSPRTSFSTRPCT